MKFYKSTCLHFLDEPLTLSSFTISEDWQHTDMPYKLRFVTSILGGWNDVKEMFGRNIRYITTPFHKAYINSKSKFANIFDSEEIEESGTLISSVPHEVNTIFYYIHTEGKGENWQCHYTILHFSKQADKEKPSLNCFVSSVNGVDKSYISDIAHNGGLEPLDFFCDIFTMLLFLKYCDLETKIIAPGKKEKHIGEKYLNETKHKIEVLNSTWFTTIIRSEGFGVEGHFRLQPCGPGMKERKLIYIAPFEKHGYTRKATVLNNEAPV